MLLAERHPSADPATTNPTLTYTTVYCSRAGNAAFAPGPHDITLKVSYEGFFPCGGGVAISTARVTVQQPAEIALAAPAAETQLCFGATSVTVEFPQARVQLAYGGELQLAAVLNGNIPCAAVVNSNGACGCNVFYIAAVGYAGSSSGCTAAQHQADTRMHPGHLQLSRSLFCALHKAMAKQCLQLA